MAIRINPFREYRNTPAAKEAVPTIAMKQVTRQGEVWTLFAVIDHWGVLDRQTAADLNRNSAVDGVH